MTRKVLFLISSATSSPVHDLLRLYESPEYSVSGILTHGEFLPSSEHQLPFPCHDLTDRDHTGKEVPPSHVSYADMLQMIFESDAIVSCG